MEREVARRLWRNGPDNRPTFYPCLGEAISRATHTIHSRLRASRDPPLTVREDRRVCVMPNVRSSARPKVVFSAGRAKSNRDSRRLHNILSGALNGDTACDGRCSSVGRLAWLGPSARASFCPSQVAAGIETSHQLLRCIAMSDSRTFNDTPPAT